MTERARQEEEYFSPDDDGRELPSIDETSCDEMQPSPAPGWQPLVSVAGMILVVAVWAYLLRHTALREWIQDPEWREALGDFMGPWLWVAYLGAGAALVGLGFPRVLYTFLGGGLFGFVRGMILGHLVSLFGSMGCFFFARHLGRRWVARHFGHRFDRVERLMQRDGFTIVLLARVCPVGSGFVINCLSGVSAISTMAYFNASLLGHLPQTVVYALLGSGMSQGAGQQMGLGILLFVLFTALFAVYFRRSPWAARVASALGGDSSSPS